MLWDHFNAFTNGIARFKWNVFLGQSYNVAIIWFVLMNAYRHLFGSLISPTVSSSLKQGVIMFFFFDHSYYCSNHSSHHVFAIGNLSLGVSQDGLSNNLKILC